MVVFLEANTAEVRCVWECEDDSVVVFWNQFHSDACCTLCRRNCYIWKSGPNLVLGSHFCRRFWWLDVCSSRPPDYEWITYTHRRCHDGSYRTPQPATDHLDRMASLVKTQRVVGWRFETRGQFLWSRKKWWCHGIHACNPNWAQEVRSTFSWHRYISFIKKRLRVDPTKRYSNGSRKSSLFCPRQFSLQHTDGCASIHWMGLPRNKENLLLTLSDRDVHHLRVRYSAKVLSETSKRPGEVPFPSMRRCKYRGLAPFRSHIWPNYNIQLMGLLPPRCFAEKIKRLFEHVQFSCRHVYWNC